MYSSIHADDVARVFCLALSHREKAIGQSFHVVSPQAVTMEGYAKMIASWFGCEAKLCFLPWNEWKKHWTEDEVRLTWNIIGRGSHYSIEKARKLLNFEPGYSSLEALHESVIWLHEHGKIG